MDRPRKTSRGHIRRPKPAIVEASVSVDTMADILESIDVQRSDGLMRIEKRFVWYTVQWSGYPTVKVVIGERRATNFGLSLKSHSIVLLNADHTSDQGEHRAHVEASDGLQEEGKRGCFIPPSGSL